MKNNFEKKFETAVFGGGCFWCVEAAFAKLKGIVFIVSGYAGGTNEKPTYENVCSGKTGHAEIVKIEFDPEIISYQDLLSVFFTLHDPTTPDRQGSDVGPQYRSIILYENDEQKKEAEEFIQKLNADKTFASPTTTEIKPLEKFWPAEEYHQKYFEKNPSLAYCQVHIPPKIGKLREKFGKLMK